MKLHCSRLKNMVYFSSLNYIIHVCSICVCAHVHEVYCVHACGVQWLLSGIFSSHSLPYFLRQGHYWTQVRQFCSMVIELRSSWTYGKHSGVNISGSRIPLDVVPLLHSLISNFFMLLFFKFISSWFGEITLFSESPFLCCLLETV